MVAGFWQLNRATAKQALLSAFAAGDREAPLTRPVADQRAEELRYRRLLLRGRYDSQHQILLDNMLQDGRPGYHVMTPLLRGGGKAVLVNRGWVPANALRTHLPDVPVDGRERRVRGRLNLLPRPGLRLANPPQAADAPWPRRLSFPTAGDITAQLGYPVHAYQLMMDPDEDDGYVRDWQPGILGPERHVGYAIQWFAFAIVLVIIYLVVNVRQRPPTRADA